MPPKIALLRTRNGGFVGFLWFYARILIWLLAAAGFVLLAGLQFRQITIAATPEYPLAAEPWAIEIRGAQVLISEQTFAVDPAKTYRLSADIRVLPKNDGSLADSIFYLGVQTFDKNGQELKSGPGTYRYAGANNKVVGSQQGWVHVEGEITGEGDDSYNQFRPGTRSVRLVLLPNYQSSDDSVLRIRSLSFSERITLASESK